MQQPGSHTPPVPPASILPRCCVLLLCGLPAVGKTSFAELVKERLPQLFVHACTLQPSRTACATTTLTAKALNIVHLEYDQVFVEIVNARKRAVGVVETGEEEEQLREIWKTSRTAAYQKVEAILLQQQQKGGECQHTLVIVDDNMHYHSMRLPFEKLARSCTSRKCRL